ncbi:unnamed protein product [Schistocephalus solidus]|uniref:Dynein light chain n=1 Tax=Schistocephalus solidus TaxID=70667 RepID=A0A183SDF9_SCHSO|nr:unnamed protein product [Schistocephalus solidus]
MDQRRQEGRAIVKNADMPEDMQQDAVEVATTAMNHNTIEKEIAAEIKKEFDRRFNPNWHCIVGRNFGCYVTHETKSFIYFLMGQTAILLFKSG